MVKQVPTCNSFPQEQKCVKKKLQEEEKSENTFNNKTLSVIQSK